MRNTAFYNDWKENREKDANGINYYSQYIRGHKRKSHPEGFFTARTHLMDKREKQGGDSNGHKLYAGAGKRDHELMSVIDIAFAGNEMKRNAAQSLNPPYGGRQNPSETVDSRSAIKIFHPEKRKKACQIEDSVVLYQCV